MELDIFPTEYSNKSFDDYYFLYTVGDNNCHEHPMYNVYSEDALPQATFIAFDMYDERDFFLADHCPDQIDLDRPNWESSVIQIPISPLVTYDDLEKLSKDSFFYDMFTSLRDGFQRESHDYPHEYTDHSKVKFLEIESYLKNIKVPEIINHWEYYRELKSRPRPITNTSCYPGVFSGEVSMFFKNHRYTGY